MSSLSLTESSRVWATLLGALSPAAFHHNMEKTQLSNTEGRNKRVEEEEDMVWLARNSSPSLRQTQNKKKKKKKKAKSWDSIDTPGGDAERRNKDKPHQIKQTQNAA